MDCSTLATTWTSLAETAKILILTEAARMPLAERIKADNQPYAASVMILDIGTEPYEAAMHSLSPDDLLLVLLTVDGFMQKGYRETFSPFSKPDGCESKYIFIRLDIPEASLLSGLNTAIAKAEHIIRDCEAFTPGKTVRVTTAAGTDITMQVDYQELLPYHARERGGHAFLPPAEISEELVPGSANGVIVADITVGELRFGAALIDSLGLVDEPVRITVEHGLVKNIEGGSIARRLQDGLNRLDKSLQTLVELGHGLSDLTPTGIIGVDESMNGTCHFGIGSRDPYHVDVVVANPTIAIV